MNIHDFIIELLRLRNNRNENENYFLFIERTLNEMLLLCKSVDNDNLIHHLNNSPLFKDPYTKRRFCFLIKHINDTLLKILKLCYQGDIFSAKNELVYLLTYKDRTIKRNLKEDYIGFFNFDILTGNIFYRMRDDDGEIDNCYHVPFYMRYNSGLMRFSMAGVPSLYLADSKETANKELGDLEKEFRYFSQYQVITSKRISLLDLSMPSEQEIEDMNEFQKLAFIITYPFRFACSVKTLHPGAPFKEEYFLPQLIYHTLFYGNQIESFGNFRGLQYTSTKNPKGKCVVFPARYTSSDNLTQMEFDESLLNLFDITAPELFEKKKISVEGA